MTKPRKKQGNPDFRHRVSCPAPTNQHIESRLIELLTPGTFANLKDVKGKERSLRDAYGGLCLRILTLPVMAAIVLSLVYRHIQHLTDVLRCLEVEGLMWVEAMSVSRQALRLLGLSYLWVGGTNGVQMLFLCYLDFLRSTQ